MKPKKSRNAIITGSTQGIGLAIAREFLERGHAVYICGRDEKSLLKVLGIFYEGRAERGAAHPLRRLRRRFRGGAGELFAFEGAGARRGAGRGAGGAGRGVRDLTM